MYQKYAPLWEKEEMERSQRWNAFLGNFPSVYAQAKPERYANAPTLTASKLATSSSSVDRTLPVL